MEKEKCMTCRFHDGVLCRKNAPVPLLTHDSDVGYDEEGSWRPTAWWPETGPEEWCGEYKSRVAEDNQTFNVYIYNE